MEIDYPAAHSMDTEWFAVDKDGCIAIMESYEPGAVPSLFLKTSPYGEELLEEIATATGAQLQFKVVDKDYSTPKAESVGVFRYECDYDLEGADDEYDDEALPPYGRTETPAKPLTISDLPADLALKLQVIKFDRISFKESHLVQPIEFMECEIWGKYERCYLSDGTVSPIAKEHIAAEQIDTAPQAKPGNKPWWQKIFSGEN